MLPEAQGANWRGENWWFEDIDWLTVVGVLDDDEEREKKKVTNIEEVEYHEHQRPQRLQLQ